MTTQLFQPTEKTKGTLPKRLGQRGAILIGVLVIGLTLTVIAVALMSFTTSTYNLSTRGVYNANATSVAEAAVETSLYQLNASSSFTGYGSEQVFFNDANQGKGVFTTAVASAGTNAKTIVATGKVYRYGTTTNPVSTRKIKVTVVGTASPGYSVHSGPGGLILGGSANITNATVYVNGSITMSGAAKIGTNAQPEKVYVVNMRCPIGTTPGATYPAVCSGGTGGQPIALSGSAQIYGTVCATGQTDNTRISGGSSGDGLQAGCTAPPVNTPIYDRAAHKAAVTTTTSGTSNTYTCANYPFDRTWPANLRLTGNVNIAGSCNVVINGNAHITGDLTLGGASKITVSDSVGTTRPVVMVDGKITVGGSAQLLANNQATGIQFVSSKSSATCNPECTSLSGNDLKTSQSLETVSIGGGTNLPGMIFQSQWGKATLGGSGSVGAIVGQTVDLSGAGTVLFGTSLSSGTTTWSITGYQRTQ